MRRLLFLLLLTAIFSCKDSPHKKAKIHSWVTHDQSDPNILLYWYILYGNNGTYYTYSSPTAVTSFSGINWQTTNELPSAIANQPEAQTFEEPVNDLPNEIEIEASEIDNSSSETDASGSSESGSSDASSSSDSGGGDSGGSSGD